MRKVKMRTCFNLLMLLSSYIVAEDVKKSIFHENDGVFWMHQGVLETVQNVWHYTFAVEI